MTNQLDRTFKLFEFNVYNNKSQHQSSDEDEDGSSSFNKDNATFAIQMFGINEEGQKASILVEDYEPFFFLKVGDKWTKAIKDQFVAHLKARVGKYYENSIVECKLIEKKKLYEQVEALPEKSREVFKAIVLENMKYKEVAEHLDISVNTVKTHYARALKQLRLKLDIIIMLMLI